MMAARIVAFDVSEMHDYGEYFLKTLFEKKKQKRTKQKKPLHFIMS